MSEQKCTYCHGSDCQVCQRRVARDVLAMVTLLECEMAKDDEADFTGIITNHMRAAWGLRDALNDYFNAGCDMKALTDDADPATLGGGGQT